VKVNRAVNGCLYVFDLILCPQEIVPHNYKSKNYLLFSKIDFENTKPTKNNAGQRIVQLTRMKRYEKKYIYNQTTGTR